MSGIVGGAGSKSGLIDTDIRFVAHGNSQGSTSIADNAYIIWGAINVNKGGGYNTSNGYFTAPISGYYNFEFSYYSYSSDPDTYSFVYYDVTNSAVILRCYHRNLPKDSMMHSALYNHHMVGGEQLGIRNGRGYARSIYLDSEQHGLFQGYLQQAGGKW